MTKTHPEYQYLNTLKDILDHGEKVPNRTGVDTLRLLGITHRYDFKDGFPLLTTKKVWLKGVVHELLWFLSGSTSIKHLIDNEVNIWNDDAWNYFKRNWKEKVKGEPCPPKERWLELVKKGTSGFGELGPVYGKQWRSWTEAHPKANTKGRHVWVDQIENLIDGLKNNPSSRRHILSAWNVADIDHMALPPCHLMSQFTISNGKLWCQMYQRSCDLFLGVPFNIASYSLLTYMIAQVCNLEPGGFIWTGHDVHIYENHIDAAKEQLTREPKEFPMIQLNPHVSNIDDFKYEDITVANYNPHPAIKAELNT
jgi:thymidylate synthase